MRLAVRAPGPRLGACHVLSLRAQGDHNGMGQGTAAVVDPVQLG